MKARSCNPGLRALAPPGTDLKPAARTSADPVESTEAEDRVCLGGSSLALGALALIPATLGLVPQAAAATEATTVRESAPLSARLLETMRERARPGAQDNRRAASVRTEYGVLVERLAEESRDFQPRSRELLEQARELERSDRLIGPCPAPTGDFSLTTRRYDGTNLTTRHQGRRWTVEYSNHLGENRALEEFPEHRRLTVNGQIRTLHLEPGPVTEGGDFDLVVSGKSQKDTVRVRPDGSIFRESQGVFTEPGGTRRLRIVEDYQFPTDDTALYRLDRTLKDQATGKEQRFTQRIEVRADGSTRVTETLEGRSKTWEEPGR